MAHLAQKFVEEHVTGGFLIREDAHTAADPPVI